MKPLTLEDLKAAASRGILEILRQDGNKDDLVAFLEEHLLPLDEAGRNRLAGRILKEPPTQGYLTVSNALQWRLQYGFGQGYSVEHPGASVGRWQHPLGHKRDAGRTKRG